MLILHSARGRWQCAAPLSPNSACSFER